jgi:hypothetical protein
MTGLSRRRLLAGAGAALLATSCSGGDDLKKNPAVTKYRRD